MTYHYSPFTGEYIVTSTPAPWMASTELAPPVFDPVTQACVYQEDVWVVSDVPPAAKSVPQVVSMRQARIALLAAGHLATVTAAVASMPGMEGDVARIEWEYAQDVRRDSPLVQSLSAALNLDQSQMDALFLAASAL